MALPFMLLAAQAIGVGGGLLADERAQRIENKFYKIGMNLERQAMEADISMNQAALNFQNQSSQLRLDMDLAQIEVGKEQLKLRMEQEQANTLQEAQLSLESLREVMASHQAIFAARGQKMAGSAMGLSQKQLRQFNREEHARTLASEYRKLSNQSKNRLLDTKRSGTLAAKSLLDIDTASKSHLLNIKKQSQNNLMDMASLSRKYIQRSQRTTKWAKAGLNMFSFNQALGPLLNG